MSEPTTGDALPEDLDVTNFVGPTVFPDNGKRRITGTIDLVGIQAYLASADTIVG